MPGSRRRRIDALVCKLFVVAMGCLLFCASAAAQRPVVYTVNYPLQYFAKRIAGEHADVIFPAPPGLDPAFWSPDVDVIGQFQKADLILLNGAGYAKWVSRASLPRRKLVNTSAGFRDRLITTDGGVTHSHGREGSHSHTGTAFTTWLDFSQAIEQARAVRDALTSVVPQHQDTFDANFMALERELLRIDARLQNIVARDPGKPLFASHPVYQYLARRYALNLKSMMWEPQSVAQQSEWQNIRDLSKQHRAKWMLWESEPSHENQARLHKLGIQSVVFDHCSNRPFAGDFLSVMLSNVNNMERIFGP
jgi:zinc transport system substrate-binding protein